MGRSLSEIFSEIHNGNDLFYRYIVDVILILIFVAIVWVAGKKGFIASVLELVAVFFAFVIATQVCAPASVAVYERYISTAIVEKVDDKIESNESATELKEAALAFIDSIPDELISLAKSAGADISSLENKISDAEIGEGSLAKQIESKILAPVIIEIIKILMFVIIFLISMSIMKLIIKTIDRFFGIPVLRTINMVFGALLGAVKGVLLIGASAVVFDFIRDMSPYSFLGTVLGYSHIMKFFMNTIPPITELIK